MSFPRLESLLVGAALAVAVTGVHAAQRTFVASFGLDTNACTISAPCRTFQPAVNAVDAGGEVVALDSAGYGPITINKSVQVIAPPGVHAGITALGGSNGVTVNAGAQGVVTLRGLHLTRGDTFNSGILFLRGAALFVRRRGGSRADGTRTRIGRGRGGRQRRAPHARAVCQQPPRDHRVAGPPARE